MNEFPTSNRALLAGLAIFSFSSSSPPPPPVYLLYYINIPDGIQLCISQNSPLGLKKNCAGLRPRGWMNDKIWPNVIPPAAEPWSWFVIVLPLPPPCLWTMLLGRHRRAHLPVVAMMDDGWWCCCPLINYICPESSKQQGQLCRVVWEMNVGISWIVSISFEPIPTSASSSFARLLEKAVYFGIIDPLIAISLAILLQH